MLRSQTTHSPKQGRAQNSKEQSSKLNSPKKNNAPQLAAALLAAGAADISQLSGLFASGDVGSNIALLALAEQQSLKQAEQSNRELPLLGNGLPVFEDGLPENLAPEGSFSGCSLPTEAQGLPAAQLSWFV